MLFNWLPKWPDECSSNHLHSLHDDDDDDVDFNDGDDVDVYKFLIEIRRYRPDFYAGHVMVWYIHAFLLECITDDATTHQQQKI